MSDRIATHRPVLTAARRLARTDVFASHSVLRLQRAIGNQAVQQLIGVVQRCGGEVHDGCACADGGGSVARQAVATGLIERAPATDSRPPLTSPRFAGDTVLEACHQDRARLSPGARGAPVQKVQQALLDLGFDLGPKGADASYGSKTAQAVREFKSRERLGFEQFGDVGPGTMSRLDQLFPPANPKPTPKPDDGPPDLADEENGTLACPASNDIVTAIESDSALREPLQRNLVQAPTVTVGNPLSIQGAVNRFKALVDAKDATGARKAGANISTKGQFFIIGLLREVISAELNRIRGAGDADAVAFANQGTAAMASLRDKGVDKLIARCDKIAAKTTSPEKAAMQALLRPAGSGGSIDATLFAAFDLSPNDTMPPNLLVKFRSIRAAKNVVIFDATACGGAALRIAQRIKRKAGLTPRQPKGPSASAQLSAGSGFEDMRPMGAPATVREPDATAAVSPNSAMMFGDVINQTGVGSAVGQMRQALAAGKTIHARVVSGLGYGQGTTASGKKTVDLKAKRFAIGAPPEEHSLLIIGFEGNRFVFHDPDSGVSSSPEQGFGLLTFDSGDGRLSTAFNAGDMTVDAGGEHSRGDKRYQVIRIESV